MFWTGRVEYYGRVVIFISVNISRPLLRVLVFVPASVVIIIVIIIIVIIFSRDVVLIGLFIF